MNPLLAKLRDKRASLKSTIDGIVENVEKEERDALTEVEERNLRDARTEIEALDARIEELSEMELRNAAAAELAAKVDEATNHVVNTAPARVTREERTYTPESGRSFITDAYRSTFSADFSARERIERHMREEEIERRDVGTGAFTGLVVPQYLTDQVVELARAGRPVANSVRRVPLPSEGMTLSVGRVTTGSATAVQATENSAVQETDMDDTLLNVGVATIAGQQDVSRQALERGAGVDQLIFGDLAADYAVKLDTQVINGSGSSGQMLGILNTSSIEAVTYTDASPTVAEAFPKIADAVQRVNSNRYAPATAIFMHPRRWGWFTAAVDTAGRPLVPVQASAPQNAIGVGDAAKYGQVVGQVLGLPIITDANIPTNLGAGTNEDIIVVARASDLVLWEIGDGSPAELRFEQTTGGSLTVKLVVYSYAAFTAGRYPKAIATVGGTGLVTPTF